MPIVTIPPSVQAGLPPLLSPEVSSRPPILPRWLCGTFRLDIAFLNDFRNYLATIHSSPIAFQMGGDYLWYQSINDSLEAKGDPRRLVIVSRESRQHYLLFSDAYEQVFIGAERWGRKIFTTPGLMTSSVRRYRMISGIFQHSENSTVLSKRVKPKVNNDTIGLEIEVSMRESDSSANTVASKLYNEGTLDVRGGRFVIPCYDGSLGSRGVEYKTAIFDLDFWLGKVAADWRKRFRAQGFLAYGRTECGLHINIGRNNTFRSDKVCHMTQAFLFSPRWGYVRETSSYLEVYESLMRVACRHYLNNTYCNGGNVEYHILGAYEKYQPMRMGSDRVEFRIFQSSTKPERLRILPVFCIEVGKSVARLEHAFDMVAWRNDIQFRAQWGHLVWADIIQNCKNEDLLAWLDSTIRKKAMRLFSEVELPVNPATNITWVDENGLASLADLSNPGLRRAG